MEDTEDLLQKALMEYRSNVTFSHCLQQQLSINRYKWKTDLWLYYETLIWQMNQVYSPHFSSIVSIHNGIKTLNQVLKDKENFVLLFRVMLSLLALK